MTALLARLLSPRHEPYAEHEQARLARIDTGGTR